MASTDSVVELSELLHAILLFASQNKHASGWPEAICSFLLKPLCKHDESGRNCALDKALDSTGLRQCNVEQAAMQNVFHMCDMGMMGKLSYLDLAALRQTLFGACKGESGKCRLLPLKFDGPPTTTWGPDKFKYELRICLEHLPEAFGHRVSDYKGQDDPSQFDKKYRFYTLFSKFLYQMWIIPLKNATIVALFNDWLGNECMVKILTKLMVTDNDSSFFTLPDDASNIVGVCDLLASSDWEKQVAENAPMDLDCKPWANDINCEQWCRGNLIPQVAQCLKTFLTDSASRNPQTCVENEVTD